MINTDVQKVVVQCSGGIESTALLAMAIKEFGKENVFPIVYKSDSIFWQNRDSIATKRVLINLGLAHKAHYCSIPNSDLWEYPRDDTFEDVGFIPGYKLIMNVNALSYAQVVGADAVYIGNMEDNVYPDETKEFLLGVEKLYNATYCLAGSAQRKPIKFVTPFKGMSKSDVIRDGYVLLGKKIFDTLSCGDERFGGGLNCGVCPWCTKRIKGFEEVDIIDLTPYANGALTSKTLWENTK